MFSVKEWRYGTFGIKQCCSRFTTRPLECAGVQVVLRGAARVTVWALADLHGSRRDEKSGLPVKPMDQFGPQWVHHIDRLEASWSARVAPDDTVILAGDTDWALRLEEAMDTLARIDSWSGKKILVRGNHDYWWSSKTTSRVTRAVGSTVLLLHNNSYQFDGVNVCGAKGSPVPGAMDWTEENEKILNRELLRLRASLESRDADYPTIVALHYPPFYPSHGTSPYKDLLEEHAVSICVYGHLHGESAQSGPRGDFGGIRYQLVAGDALQFCPTAIWEGGRSRPWLHE